MLILLAALAALGGCGRAPAGGEANDRFAGLDGAIKSWRDEIAATTPVCQAKGGKGCVNFEVACKGERKIAAAEQQHGVSAKVLVAITWQAQDPAQSQSAPDKAFAEFSRAGGAWSRKDGEPVNLSTCAPL